MSLTKVLSGLIHLVDQKTGQDRREHQLICPVRLPGIPRCQLRPSGLRIRLLQSEVPRGVYLRAPDQPMGFYSPAVLVDDAKRHGLV